MNVHSELFIINKSLISVVFTYAVKDIYTQLSKIFTTIPKFCANSACQTYVDLFCLSDTFKVYTPEETREIYLRMLSLIPKEMFESNKESRKLMTRIRNDFFKSMAPYVAVMQQQPPPTSVTIAFASSSTTSSTINLSTSATSQTSIDAKKDEKTSL